MELVHEPEAFRRACDEARARGLRVGLVPTMGALHAGHAALIAEARRHASFVVVSIFVNPTQFGPAEDFARYPRTLEADAATCERAGAAAVFAPAADAMYRPGDETRVRVGATAAPLCGAHRPGHFEGVATVVAKLFALTGPSVAVFGRKDYQQLRVISRFTADLFLPVEIVGLRTVREPDGLALSSRNAYLSPEQRAAALAIPRGLSAAVDRVRARGTGCLHPRGPGARERGPRRHLDRLRRRGRPREPPGLRARRAHRRARAPGAGHPAGPCPAHRQRGARRGPCPHPGEGVMRGEENDGLFVVLEGIDGAGTTTQAERLAAHLRSQRRLVHVTREPSTGPIGAQIRLMLTHRIALPAEGQAEMMALLFAADRLDHVASEIAPHLRDGYVVLSDRYDMSSLAYQSITAVATGEAPQAPLIGWIRELNRFARRPDVTIVLDVSPDVAAARRRARGGAAELFDDAELQARLAGAYLRGEELVPGDRVVHVDGDADPATVARNIAEVLAPFTSSRSA